MGGSFGRGKRGAGPGAFQNSDRPAGRGEGAARSHCGGRGRVTAAFRSGGVRGCSRRLLVCLLPLALRRAAGLEVGGRPVAASPFRGRLSGAAAAAAGACLVGTRLAFPPPRRGVIPKRCRGCTGFWYIEKHRVFFGGLVSAGTKVPRGQCRASELRHPSRRPRYRWLSSAGH